MGRAILDFPSTRKIDRDNPFLSLLLQILAQIWRPGRRAQSPLSMSFCLAEERELLELECKRVSEALGVIQVFILH
jgi:hypothetical protein